MLYSLQYNPDNQFHTISLIIHDLLSVGGTDISLTNFLIAALGRKIIDTKKYSK